MEKRAYAVPTLMAQSK